MSTAGIPVTLILEDRLARTGLAQELAQGGFQTVSLIGDPRELSAETHSSELILTDVSFGGAVHWNLIQTLRERFPTAKIAVLTDSNEAKLFLRAVLDGAQGFFHRSLESELLLSNLHSVCASDALIIGPVAVAAIRQQMPHVLGLTSLSHLPGMTEDDIRLLPLLLSGATLDQISNTLEISSRTAQRRLNALSSKLGARSWFEAGVKATKLGLV